MNKPTRFRAIRLGAVLLVLVCTVGCDQATKHFARTELSQLAPQALPGGFVELTLAENPGAFLSLGASLPATVRGALLTLAVGLGLAILLAYLLGGARLRRLSFLGLALILAGGTSNLVDRLARHGLVTDFMVIRAGPFHTGIFNGADLAIVAGALMLVLSLRGISRKGEARGSESDSST
jgi:signal peptidase II